MGVLSKTGKERWISMRAENVLACLRARAPMRGPLAEACSGPRTGRRLSAATTTALSCVLNFTTYV